MGKYMNLVDGKSITKIIVKLSELFKKESQYPASRGMVSSVPSIGFNTPRSPAEMEAWRAHIAKGDSIANVQRIKILKEKYGVPFIEKNPLEPFKSFKTVKAVSDATKVSFK